ncbi:TauD/TfdA family dioxygenase [Pseudomonas vanderleydeniana]|uniref:TauD/TfdA family dioxygenase n=1 Tax=Pseudomonas vanderleydeniana TaxID=2745495 RepID=A0A9E6PKI6_9PSED|nr:TauD/TfdA family dioxygenase [Pseudomonas vanderleydeniana]QXI28176.1 TauD/TfdA family dioxygenase [Pseudomonas vanderleydeniana]
MTRIAQAWNRDKLIERSLSWIHRLDRAQVIEIDCALKHAQRRGLPPLEMTPRDFPLPTVQPLLQRAVLESEQGLGVYLITGFPVLDKTPEQARLLAWGIGLHLGVPLVQNHAGELLVDVRDQQQPQPSPHRSHVTSRSMEFHTDACDLTTLLCLRQAARGGLFRLASLRAVHDRLMRENPRLCQALYQPLAFHDPTHDVAGTRRFFLCPVFALERDTFASRFYRQRNLDCERLPGAPRLSNIARAALNAVHSTACLPDMCLELELLPGDLQFLNNHLVCHARTRFTDSTQPGHQRHLLRQWHATACSRPLPDSFLPAYGDVRARTLRGGYQGWPCDEALLAFQRRLAMLNGLLD